MKLHPYQINGVNKALAAIDKRWIFNDEMGLGKTAQAIEAMKQLKVKTALIVCPAIVRYAWNEEFDKWWVGHPEVGLLTASRSRMSLSKKETARLELAYEAPIRVVSYNLVDTLPIRLYDVIILDETHRVKSPSSQWSKYLRELCEYNKISNIFGLTATLMPNQPLDAIGVCECIWPGRFGGLSKNGDLTYIAKARYTNVGHNGWAKTYTGINEAHAAELKHRLSSSSSRTTKLQVAHLLPPFDVRNLTTDPPKRAAVKEWLQDTREQNTHIAILTHLRDTATKLAYELKADYLITGAMLPEKRNQTLAEAKNKPTAIIVATMHSIGIGIDLTFCQSALFAELYYRPETMIQALGRFSRLSGKVPTSCTLMIEKNSNDEIIAKKLGEKIMAINMAIEAGLTDTKLDAVLNDTTGWNDELFIAIAKEIPEDDY